MVDVDEGLIEGLTVRDRETHMIVGEWKTYGGRWIVEEIGYVTMWGSLKATNTGPPPLLKVEWQGGSGIQL
jgi:hypothetical protein